MQEWTDQQDLPKPQEKKQAPVSTGRAPGTLTPKKMPALQRTYSVAGTAPGEDTPSQGDMQAAAPPIQQGKVDDGRPSIPSSNQHAVYLPELTTKEKQGLEIELDKFSSYEVEKEGDGKMSYVPVFVPREEARGHYEGYCKTSTCCLQNFQNLLLTHSLPLLFSSLATFPLLALARLSRPYSFPRPNVDPLPSRQQTIRRTRSPDLQTRRLDRRPRLPSSPRSQDDPRNARPAITRT